MTNRYEELSSKDLVGVNGRALGRLTKRDLEVRFAFRAAISLIAAVVALVLGNRPGGVFLALPAILSASATLVAKEQSKLKAERLEVGALMGALALVAFAIIVWQELPGNGAVVVLLGALGAWVAGAVTLYFAFRLGLSQAPRAVRGAGTLRCLLDRSRSPR